jgi:hypothetical protein
VNVARQTSVHPLCVRDDFWEVSIVAGIDQKKKKKIRFSTTPRLDTFCRPIGKCIERKNSSAGRYQGRYDRYYVVTAREGAPNVQWYIVVWCGRRARQVGLLGTKRGPPDVSENRTINGFRLTGRTNVTVETTTSRTFVNILL